MTPAESARREFLHTVAVQRGLASALGVPRPVDEIDREIADCRVRDRAIDRALAEHRHARDVEADTLRWEVGYLTRLLAEQDTRTTLRIVA